MSKNANDLPRDGNDNRSVTALFHGLSSVLPIDQTIISVLPEPPVEEALDLLKT